MLCVLCDSLQICGKHKQKSREQDLEDSYREPVEARIGLLEVAGRGREHGEQKQQKQGEEDEEVVGEAAVVPATAVI